MPFVEKCSYGGWKWESAKGWFNLLGIVFLRQIIIITKKEDIELPQDDDVGSRTSLHLITIL